MWRERLPKISELSKSLAAQHVDNLYLKTLCELTAVISALVYKCTCTITDLALQELENSWIQSQILSLDLVNCVKGLIALQCAKQLLSTSDIK